MRGFKTREKWGAYGGSAPTKEGNTNEDNFIILGIRYLRKEIMELTAKQAAAYLGISPQALYVATRNGRIKFTGKFFKKYVKTDLDKYKASKYSRKSHFDANHMSVKEAAEELGVKLQTAYYMIRTGKIEADFFNGMYLIDRQKFKSVIKSYETQIRCKAND